MGLTLDLPEACPVWAPPWSMGQHRSSDPHLPSESAPLSSFGPAAAGERCTGRAKALCIEIRQRALALSPPRGLQSNLPALCSVRTMTQLHTPLPGGATPTGPPGPADWTPGLHPSHSLNLSPGPLVSRLPLEPGNCPTGDPRAHGPQPKEGQPGRTEGAGSRPGRLGSREGTHRAPQGSRTAGCGAATGLPACLRTQRAEWRQGPTVWAGGGSWPGPRAASRPRTLPPAV